jgi:tellurite methyltransferase
MHGSQKQKNNMLSEIGKTDVYLLDQIMRGRIHPKMRLLDAGCGWGRNSEYFIKNDFEIYGVDRSEEAIMNLKSHLSEWKASYPKERFSVADLNEIPFPNNHFDFIICSAVLHFCESRAHFIALFEEMIRVLKPSGIFWFRMTTKHTIEHIAKHLYDDIYVLPDGSTRYLLDRNILHDLMKKHELTFLDPFKTVNVSDIRTMATVVLKK